MNTINLKLYDFARNKFKLSEADAKEFVQTIDEVVQEEAKHGGGEFKSAVKEDMLGLELRFTKELASVENRLANKISDQFKWMIGIFITLVVMILGLYAAILLKK